MKPLIAPTTRRDWQTLLAIDFDKWAAQTYRANFPGVRVECGPVSDYIGVLPDADVILGGPPCQPFSDAGENEGENDERDCIPDFVAAVEKVRPRQFLMENVRGLLKAKHYAYFCQAIERLSSLGYVVKWKLLDAVSFGVPQFRERVWVWGIRSNLHSDGMRHVWPAETHQWPPPQGNPLFGESLLAGVMVRDALGLWCAGGDGHDGCCVRPMVVGGGSNPHFVGDARTERDITDEPSTTIPASHTHNAIPSLVIHRMRGKGMEERHGERPDHEITEPSPAITVSKGGGGTPLFWRTENPVLWRWSDALFDKQPPIDLDKPCPTIVKNWMKGTPYGCLKWKQTLEGLWIRRLHPLECARLQSVPDCFAWPEDMPKTHAYRVIGNGWSSRMGAVFSTALRTADPDARTIIDLFCGGGLGAVGWHGRFWSYEPEAEVAA